jgi:hypothetical protein
LQVLHCCDFCVGNHLNGACGSFEVGNSYQSQYYAPSSKFYPQTNNYLPSMMSHQYFSYQSSNYLQSDTSHYMPNPQDSCAQELNQPYGNAIQKSHEVRQAHQVISPSLEIALLSFMQ